MTDVRPPTYPMRPLSGGPWPKAKRFARPGMYYEPKYNGWRALVHIPTGTMFSRQLNRLSIEAEFKSALDAMRTTLDAEAFKWADCEALERRHNIGKGCLIVLDVVPEPALYPKATYEDRREWLSILPELDSFVVTRRIGGGLAIPKDGPMPLLSIPPQVAPDSAWDALQEANRIMGCEFYEGLVAKRGDSPYTVQLRSSDQESPFWLKYRWKF